ncbi:MAG: sodium:proton antiporter [Bacteroidia bacterium]
MLLLSTSHLPAYWSVTPFLALLLMIATGPIFFPKTWHHYYPHISVALGVFVAVYYLFFLHNNELPVESVSEYVSFISLLTILYVASGGIYMFIDVESKPSTNIKFLAIAAVLTNLIGTTGASVLLIRPYMRINRYRLKPYQIVFFIMIVSNCGGLLTPIGDPPLFIGFLKGIPFTWTILNLWPQWLFVNGLLLLVFYFYERNNREFDDVDVSSHYTGRFILSGQQNFFWLGIALVSVFIDPNLINGLPAIEFHGKKLSFIREIIQLSSAYMCYKTANKKALKVNEFGFEPIKEVAFLFIGIFLCMMPALQLLEHYANSNENGLAITSMLLYFATGIFSSFLDNAPTYLNMLTLAFSKFGFSLSDYQQVQDFLQSNHVKLVKAISTGAVFFGALTYIGNGPNFMVKAIAEHNGVKMPTFGRYIFKYSALILLPILVLTAILFY